MPTIPAMLTNGRSNLLVGQVLTPTMDNLTIARVVPHTGCKPTFRFCVRIIYVFRVYLSMTK